LIVPVPAPVILPPSVPSVNTLTLLLTLPLMSRVPLTTVVPPVYVLAPLSVQAPLPCLVKDVGFVALLSAIAPAISPAPDVDPCNVRFFTLGPVAVNAPVNFRRPVPDWSMNARLQLLSLRSTMRSVVSPLPV